MDNLWQRRSKYALFGDVVPRSNADQNQVPLSSPSLLQILAAPIKITTKPNLLVLSHQQSASVPTRLLVANLIHSTALPLCLQTP